MNRICRKKDCVFNNPDKHQCLQTGLTYVNCDSKILTQEDKDGPTYVFTRPALWFCTKDEKKEVELLKYFTAEALNQLVKYEYLKKI